MCLVTPGCAIHHLVEGDYPQYLVNNAGASGLPKSDTSHTYFITPKTQQYRYEFRAFSSGIANLWIVEFGKMLDDTLRSDDVQNAFGGLRKASDPAEGPGDVLVFDLKHYTFERFGAHVVLGISLRHGDQVVFSKTYQEDGRTQGSKMFWGGAFAQKNAVQQSTKLALDAILRQLIKDLNRIS